MLPKYALIGRSLKIFGGRFSVLGGFLFSLSFLAILAGWFVLSSEWDAVRELSWWTKLLVALAGSFAGTRILGHFLFKPLPQDRFPEGVPLVVHEGLWNAALAALRFHELNGFARGSVFENRARRVSCR